MSNIALNTISKYIFVAYRTYSEDANNFRIILAKDLASAKTKATEHFKSSFVEVRPLTATKTTDVYNF